jgi:hypothetical protein
VTYHCGGKDGAVPFIEYVVIVFTEQEIPRYLRMSLPVAEYSYVVVENGHHGEKQFIRAQHV